jgi:hypothetical protein
MQIIAAVNHEQTLHANLLRSPLVAEKGVPVLAEWGHANAGAAYNAALAHAQAEFLAFVHQDVYLPAGWDLRLRTAIEQLENMQAPWAVLGVWGITNAGQFCGNAWCTGGNHHHAGLPGLHEVASIDEIVIVLKRSTGLRFDQDLPGYHLYATDIVLEARRRGLKSLVFDGPVIHNSRANPQPLDRHYWAAYRYMQRKWAAQLPLPTCVVPVTRSAWPLWKQWTRNELCRLRGRFTPHPRLADPAAKARALGFESPSQAAATPLTTTAS